MSQGLTTAFFAIGLALSLALTAPAPPSSPTPPRRDPDTLASIRAYCARYRAPVAIKRCVEDRAARNFIEVSP